VSLERIIFVDDEPHLVVTFKRSLQAKFNVVYFDSVYDVEPFLAENLDIMGFVVDVMMPSRGTMPQIDDLAGVKLIRTIAPDYIIPRGLPVIILSNSSADSIKSAIVDFDSRLKSLIRVYHKPNCSPDEVTGVLESKVSELLRRERR